MAARGAELTFIVFDRSEAAASGSPSEADSGALAVEPDWSVGMVGDVNLFSLDDEDHDIGVEAVADDIDDAARPEPSDVGAAASSSRASAASSADKPMSRTAEIMVMTAEASRRKQGFARLSAAMMMRYAHQELGVRVFVAKISMGNTASLSLFQSQLGFVQDKVVPAFEEVHLKLKVPAAAAAASGSKSEGWGCILALTADWSVEPFDNPELVH